LLKSKSLLGGELDCKTSYVCISGGGECEDFNPSVTVNINMDQDVLKIKNDTMKAIADEMADCWWMFGEGGVDYVTKGIVFDKAICSICSITEFDEKIKDKFKNDKISYPDFYDYLSKTKKDGTQTYLKYMYNTNNLSMIERDFNKFLNNYFLNNIKFDKQYFILTGRFEDAIFSFFIEDKSIGVTMLEKTNENYKDVGCDEFITKA